MRRLLHDPTWRLPLLLAVLLGVWIVIRVLATPLELQPDSGRYVAMGLNVSEYGVLSPAGFDPHRAPSPGLGWGGPLTAFELALVAWLHPPTEAVFRCFATTGGTGAGCGGTAWGLKAIYVLEISVFLLAVYRIALLVTGNQVKSTLAVLAALLCKETFQYARFVLTEPLFLAMLGLFLWAWLGAWLKPDRWRAWLLAGLTLGLVALVKPAWSALLPGLVLMMAWIVLRDRTRRRAFLAGIVPLALGYALVVLPLLIRNGLQLGLWSLSDPDYLAGSLAHRLAYNEMTWPEWLMGWIYYLPGFGDNLAEKFFGSEAVVRLGWSDAGYYAYGRDVLHREVLAAVGPKAAPDHLIQKYIIDQPLKNAAVTLLLLMRGIFVGGSWGAVALTLLLPALWLMRGETLRRWLVVALPALGVAVINAQASVNILRYNLALIPAFALIFATIFYWAGVWLTARFRQRA